MFSFLGRNEDFIYLINIVHTTTTKVGRRVQRLLVPRPNMSLNLNHKSIHDDAAN